MEIKYICPGCGRPRGLNDCEYCKKDLRFSDYIYNFLLNDISNTKCNYNLVDYNLQQAEIVKTIVSQKPGSNILDLGCGDGFISSELVNFNFKNIICIDNDYESLKRLEEKLKILKPTKNTRLLLADAHNLPLLDNSFDLVIANDLFHLVQEPLLVLSEIYRLLKKTGILVQISAANDNYYKEEYNDEQVKYQEIIKTYYDHYWNLAKNYNYHINKINDFNIHLEAKKIFLNHSTKTTEISSNRGTKSIKDFLNRKEMNNHYTNIHIPKDIHKLIHNKVINYLDSQYGNKFLKVKVVFETSTKSIIDLYYK